MRAYVRVWVCLHACAPQQICTMLLPYGASLQDVLTGHVHVHSVGARKTSQLDATHWAAEVRWSSLPSVPLSIPNSYRTGTARHNRNPVRLWAADRGSPTAARVPGRAVPTVPHTVA